MIRLPVRPPVSAFPSVVSAALLTALLAVAPTADADTIYVDANLTTGADDGSSWENAYQGSAGLQTALAAAVAGDDIYVADGRYLASQTGDRTASFALKNGVAIFGSFAGGELGPGGRPPFGTADSILDGDLAGNDGSNMFGDNSFHLITTTGTNASAVIDGFVVRGGNANGGGNNDRGAGILCLGAVSPTVRNCFFRDNRCTFGGAAGYVNNGGAPRFFDCSFEDGNGGSFGGAFDIAGGGAVRFERCLFRGNTAARGGALEIFATNGVVVNNCVFLENAATVNGGGGLWLGSGSDTEIRNCTIVANTSTGNAVAGILDQNGFGSVANSIVWGNAGNGNQFPFNQVNGPSVNYSLVMGGFGGPGVGNVAGDPGFLDLAAGDVRLTAGSPAIDAGINNEVVPGALTDFYGRPRLIDDPDTPDTGFGAAPLVDMGAAEFEGDPWDDLGSALAGTNGEPSLLGYGPLTAGSPIDIELSSALGNATAWLVVGFTELNAAFYGGNMVPDIGTGLAFALPTTPAGSFSIHDTWPAGVPSGFELYLQYWIEDAGALFGFAGSNAVRGTVR